MTLDAAPLKARLDGAVDTATGAVTGKLETGGASIRRLLDWLGSPLPAGPNFAAFDVKADLNALLRLKTTVRSVCSEPNLILTNCWI